VESVEGLQGRSTARAEPAIEWEETHCLLCGSCEWSTLLELPLFNPAFQGLSCTVVRCSECGLCFTNPRPSTNTIGQFYEVYAPHERCGLTRCQKQRLMRRSPRLKFWRRRHPQQHGLPRHGRGRLLDFGCGGGAFLELMHLQGWHVLGLDACAAVVDQIVAELGLSALAGTLPHAELEPESFDVVTMWHALEHVHRPMEVLRHARQVLVPGGRLVVSVPNIESALCRWCGSAWLGWDVPRHLTHFSPTTLKQMVEQAGFQIESVRLFSHALWLRESAELARRQGGHPRCLQWLSNRFLSRRVASYLSWTGQAGDLVLTATRPLAHKQTILAEQ